MSTALAPAHRPRIDTHVFALREALGADALSELSFANLWLFRAAHDYRLVDGDWPCVAGRTYDGLRHLMPLFALEQAPPDALRPLLQAHDAFYPLPTSVAARLDPAQWHCEANADDADYVYPADQFRHYRGTLLRKKHNLMRQLVDDGEPGAEPLVPAQHDAAREVLARWCEAKGREADRGPCLAALAQPLGLEGTLYRRHGEPVGFVIAEFYSPTVAVMRFAKGLDAHKGLYPYMFQHFCRAHPALQWLNFEQDLGLPNFRQTKRSYQPAMQLQKFRARLR